MIDKFKNTGTLNKCLIIDMITVFIVGIYSAICFWVKGSEPVATLEFFKWLCGGEFASTMFIFISKVRNQGKDVNNNEG